MDAVINVLWAALLVLSIPWTGLQIRDRLKTRKNRRGEEKSRDH